jgi:DNA-binding transcriptional LysR family regulator
VGRECCPIKFADDAGAVEVVGKTLPLRRDDGPHFQAVALCVAESQMLGNLPIHFARLAARLHGLELYMPPYDPPILGGCVFWHKRFDRDPANLWLRGHIEEALTFDTVSLPMALP